ncbi:DUF3100 domain-containing protein [Fusobacterium sp. IOR10]|uniref:DUF3100 domain-containing protein n=1 Tax=Fusobacterium sp. IOR10 TaxID=2665157 RepID=UPI0013D3BB6A|nr:DUF3100 domain-containing protein [Fusobacterium sp. IOR10]
MEENVLSMKNGRAEIFIKLFSMLIVIGIIAEGIGAKIILLGSVGKVVLLPMLFAMIIAGAITPHALGQIIPALKNICDDREIELAEQIVMYSLLFLGVKLGASAGPNVGKVVEAGPALLLQEFGNLGTMLIGLPIAIALGMKRGAVGATVSICREPTLGLIGEKYGINSPEGLGVMGTYMTGTVFGTIFFGLLGSLAANTSIHPYALAMASGMGSGSMMTAASQSLAASVPGMQDEILAYAATSNIMTSITGLYMVLFVSLPLANKLYAFYTKIFGIKEDSKKEEVK